jgi:hypothetical protein
MKIIERNVSTYVRHWFRWYALYGHEFEYRVAKRRYNPNPVGITIPHADIRSAASMICKPYNDLLSDPNYTLRAGNRSFRIRLRLCRFLYRLQTMIMEKK